MEHREALAWHLRVSELACILRQFHWNGFAKDVDAVCFVNRVSLILDALWNHGGSSTSNLRGSFVLVGELDASSDGVLLDLRHVRVLDNTCVS